MISNSFVVNRVLQEAVAAHHNILSLNLSLNSGAVIMLLCAFSARVAWYLLSTLLAT